MVIGLIDIIVLITLTLSILFALYRGLVCELLCISSWILAGVGALFCFSGMQEFLSEFISNKMLAGVIGAVIVVLFILIVMTIINSQITKRLRNSSLSGLDRILGFFFGGLRAILLLSLLYVAGSMVLSETRLKNMEKENFSVPYIKKSVDIIKTFIPESVLSDLNIKDDNSQTKKQPKIGTDLKRKPTPKKNETKVIDSLIKEVMTPNQSSTESPVTQPVKKEIKEAVKKEVKKKVEEVKDAVKAEAVTYQKKERESLDIMVEAIAGE